MFVFNGGAFNLSDFTQLQQAAMDGSIVFIMGSSFGSDYTTSAGSLISIELLANGYVYPVDIGLSTPNMLNLTAPPDYTFGSDSTIGTATVITTTDVRKPLVY